ncbi:MAG: hypothetical protein PHE78_00010 [Candidatus Gastranaerophilales bacterium]|nr:hypothetical protein [Candidatus Gastranaerophilales bacterium]
MSNFYYLYKYGATQNSTLDQSNNSVWSNNFMGAMLNYKNIDADAMGFLFDNQGTAGDGNDFTTFNNEYKTIVGSDILSYLNKYTDTTNSAFGDYINNSTGGVDHYTNLAVDPSEFEFNLTMDGDLYRYTTDATDFDVLDQDYKNYYDYKVNGGTLLPVSSVSLSSLGISYNQILTANGNDPVKATQVYQNLVDQLVSELKESKGGTISEADLITVTKELDEQQRGLKAIDDALYGYAESDSVTTQQTRYTTAYNFGNVASSIPSSVLNTASTYGVNSTKMQSLYTALGNLSVDSLDSSANSKEIFADAISMKITDWLEAQTDLFVNANESSYSSNTNVVNAVDNIVENDLATVYAYTAKTQVATYVDTNYSSLSVSDRALTTDVIWDKVQQAKFVNALGGTPAEYDDEGVQISPRVNGAIYNSVSGGTSTTDVVDVVTNSYDITTRTGDNNYSLAKVSFTLTSSDINNIKNAIRSALDFGDINFWKKSKVYYEKRGQVADSVIAQLEATKDENGNYVIPSIYGCTFEQTMETFIYNAMRIWENPSYVPSTTYKGNYGDRTLGNNHSDGSIMGELMKKIRNSTGAPGAGKDVEYESGIDLRHLKVADPTKDLLEVGDSETTSTSITSTYMVSKGTLSFMSAQDRDLYDAIDEAKTQNLGGLNSLENKSVNHYNQNTGKIETAKVVYNNSAHKYEVQTTNEYPEALGSKNFKTGESSIYTKIINKDASIFAGTSVTYLEGGNLVTVTAKANTDEDSLVYQMAKSLLEAGDITSSDSSVTDKDKLEFAIYVSEVSAAIMEQYWIENFNKDNAESFTDYFAREFSAYMNPHADGGSANKVFQFLTNPDDSNATFKSFMLNFSEDPAQENIMDRIMEKQAFAQIYSKMEDRSRSEMALFEQAAATDIVANINNKEYEYRLALLAALEIESKNNNLGVDFSGVTNSLATLGPGADKNPWWKEYFPWFKGFYGNLPEGATIEDMFDENGNLTMSFSGAGNMLVDPYIIKVNGVDYVMGVDSNKDGKINDAKEVLGITDTVDDGFASLVALDKNNDGYISQQELKDQGIVLEAMNVSDRLKGTTLSVDMLKGINLSTIQSQDGTNNVYGTFSVDLANGSKASAIQIFETQSYFNNLFGTFADLSFLTLTTQATEQTAVPPSTVDGAETLIEETEEVAPAQETQNIFTKRFNFFTYLNNQEEKEEEVVSVATVSNKEANLNKLIENMCWKLDVAQLTVKERYDILGSLDVSKSDDENNKIIAEKLKQVTLNG